MSGIAAIRIQVSVLGTFQGMVVLVAGMQVIIKAPCERCADTGHLLEVGRSRAQYALQAPEVPQQGAALRRPQARYRFEPVSYTHLRAHETGRNLVCRLLLEK